MFGLVTVCIVVGLILFILIRYLIAHKFEEIARDKGYTNVHVFAWVFWLGIIGMLMVVAMPDRNLHRAYRESPEPKKEKTATRSMADELPDL